MSGPLGPLGSGDGRAPQQSGQEIGCLETHPTCAIAARRPTGWSRMGWRTGAESLVNCFFFAPFLCGDIGYMRAEKYRICMGTKEILKMKIRTSKWALAITLSNGISTAWELGWSEQNGSGIEQVHPPGIANWEGTHAGVLPFLRENHWHHLHHL